MCRVTIISCGKYRDHFNMAEEVDDTTQCVVCFEEYGETGQFARVKDDCSD